MSSPLRPYTAEHENPQGEGDARPTAMQIILDDDLVNKFAGKVFLVTGTSSGIGVETVRALHATGADIFMQVRDMVKGESVKKDILTNSEGKGKLEILYMDLGSLKSIRAGAAEFLKKSVRLNVLVNNAGVRNPPEGVTEDGFETQFGTNHLGHFLLFQLLLPTLLASSTPSFNSRVVNISSAAHRKSPIVFDNLNLKGIYNPDLGYAQSKTANIHMANQIERLYGEQGLHALSLCPGGIISGAQRHDDAERLKVRMEQVRHILKNTAQGAATTVWAAVGKVWEGRGGKFLQDCGESQGLVEGSSLSNGYAPHAFDEEAEKKLWKVSCELVGEGI